MSLKKVIKELVLMRNVARSAKDTVLSKKKVLIYIDRIIKQLTEAIGVKLEVFLEEKDNE